MAFTLNFYLEYFLICSGDVVCSTNVFSGVALLDRGDVQQS